jgi:hypothetical protein
MCKTIIGAGISMFMNVIIIIIITHNRSIDGICITYQIGGIKHFRVLGCGVRV